MKTATASLFEPTLQKTENWIEQVQAQLSTDDPQDAYRALRAVLMALRDRLTVEEATDLGAQLPMLVRGFFYEGWNPSKTPRKERSREEFFAHVGELLQNIPNLDPPRVTEAVFRVLQKRVTNGEISDVRANLPSDLQSLWP